MFQENPDIVECLVHDPEVADCFLEHPIFDDQGRLPFQFPTLKEHQSRCAELQSMPLVCPDGFVKTKFNNSELICFHQNNEDRIVLAHELLPKVVKCCVESMAHAESAG